MGLFGPSKEEAALKAQLSETIIELRAQIANLDADLKARKRESTLLAERDRLKEEINSLQISKSKLVEDNEREKREVTHMVGLERKRQEFEAEQARKGIEHAREVAILEVQQENLDNERQAFAKEMEFREKRFTEEVGYLKDLMTQILERLPTVNVDRQIRETTRPDPGRKTS